MSQAPGGGGGPIVLRLAPTKKEESKPFNTLVLSAMDLVVPVEVDLDRDQKHDDQVRVAAYGGGYEVVVNAKRAEAAEGGDHWLHYTFPDVRFGAYGVSVKVGGAFVAVASVVYRKGGAFLGEERLGAKPPRPKKPAPEEEKTAAPAPAEEGPDDRPPFMDQH